MFFFLTIAKDLFDELDSANKTRFQPPNVV